jgi:hypothetical protein
MSPRSPPTVEPVQPSSFVFVAIVGLWAAYLLPQWIRRRDALGAARGGDRHSLALRVLERRTRKRRPERSSVPLLRRGAGGATAPQPAALVPPAPLVPVTATAAVPVVVPGRAAARRRAILLAALGVVTGLAIAAATAGIVPGALVGLPAGLLLADVAALRMMARRTRRPSPVRVSGSVPLSCPRPAAAGGHLPAPVAAPAPARRAVPDVEEPVPDADAVGEAVEDGGWLPVPVPPPTYTLKPMAPRPEPAPLEPLVALADAAISASGSAVRARPRLVAERPGVDLDTVLQRRRAVNG